MLEKTNSNPLECENSHYEYLIDKVRYEKECLLKDKAKKKPIIKRVERQEKDKCCSIL
jgi:hypothetical protein